MGHITKIDGHIPNHVDPPTRVPEFLGVQISLTIASLIVVCLRLYTRKFVRNMLTAEDYVSAVSMLLCLISSIVSSLGVLGGDGLHYYDVPPSVNQEVASVTSFVNQVLYQPILQLVRISILLFYATNLGKDVRGICIGLGILSALLGIAYTVVEFVQCSPPYVSWSTQRPANFTCIDQILYFRVSSIINLGLDVILFVVPLPVIWKLHVPRRSKIALSGVFSVGLVSIAAEVARIVIWFHTNDGNRENPDSSWNRVPLVDWSSVEFNTAIMCASLPHLKALVSIIIPGFFDGSVGSANRSRSNHHSGNKLKICKSRTQGQTRDSAGHGQYGVGVEGRASMYGHNALASRGDGVKLSHNNDSEEYMLRPIGVSGIWKRTEIDVEFERTLNNTPSA